MNGMNARVVAAEIVGTFILVGFGSLSVISAGATSLPAPLVVPFGFGLALLAGIVIFGHVSGAHFNPAVTLAALFDGRIGLTGAIAYMVSQVIGALLGSLGVLALFGKDLVDATRNSPASAINDVQAFGVEAILTAVFIAVILTVTAREQKQAVFVIPLTLVMIHFVAIPITGASVNPARSLAPAIVSANYEHLWVYLSAPFLGALIGWGLYRVMGVFDEPTGDFAQGDRGFEEALVDDEGNL
ncbi:MAG TPA: aquaporin [Candidatus Limnocylindrales bacterium]